MKCTNRQIGDLLWDYQLELLSPADRQRFEAHLLECDHCFQDVYALAPVFERIKAHPQPFLQELARPGFWEQAKNRFAGLKEQYLVLSPAVRWGLAAAGITALILISILPFRSPDRLADLAVIEPYPFQALSPMGGVGRSEAENTFFRGMQAYNDGRYHEALPSLQAAIALDSTDAEFQFFLGITYLLAGDAASAIAPLTAAILLDPSRFEARARWYLGNAYLLLEDGEKALEELRRVIEGGGEYEFQATVLTRRVEEFRKKELQ